MPGILICDDEKDIVNALKIYLSDPDYTLYEAFNGKEALEIMDAHEIHLILLDIMMPVMDGISAMARIRETSNVPIILLTAKSEDQDKVLGLDVGADDYVTKPFNPLEVKARVRSQLRRYLKLGGGRADQEIYRNGGIELNDRTNSSPDRVFSPREIYRAVWKEKPFGSDNTVAVHIRHLREKLEIDPAEPRCIKVIFGQGYKMEGERRK